jgi:hypothetical protein
MKLARTVYFSRSRAEIPFWQVTSEIVGASHARNSREDLTGVLLAHDGWFVQCLEGLPCRLTRLLQVIGADPRHELMQLVEFNPVGERRFGAWAMAHVVLTPNLIGQVGADFDPRRLSATTLISLLDGARRATEPKAA